MRVCEGDAGGSGVKSPQHPPTRSPCRPSGAAQRSVRPETLTGRQLQEETLTSLKKDEKNKEEKGGVFFHRQGAGLGLINFGKERSRKEKYQLKSSCGGTPETESGSRS